MLRGEVGFKRDGKGLKVAPQTLELLSPAQLIRNLPRSIKSYVKNALNSTATKILLVDASSSEEFPKSGRWRCCCGKPLGQFLRES
jgi:CRISPR-associated protein Csc3